MFARQHYLNSRGGGFPVLEVAPAGEEPGQRFVPLRRTVLSGEVVGPLADLTLTQVFGYSRADYPRPLEALYRFPLPGDAAVTGIRVRFGEVEICTRLEPRPEAEQEYERARKEGRQAALATRESPDAVTLRVTGLRPDEEVRVETRYVQLARADRGGWSLRVPLTMAPRYVRSDELSTRHARGQPLALLRDPGHRFALDLSIRGGEAVASRTHLLDVRSSDGAVRVALADGEVLPDRDCVLTWTPPKADDRPTLAAHVYAEPDGEWVYFLAQISAPPRAMEGTQPLAREVILLVDHSGSMSGPKWEAADWAVKRFLADLRPEDAFTLGVFHSDTTWLSRALLPGERVQVDRAAAFLEGEKSSGGTELGVALEQAVRTPTDGSRPARHVLIITDAQVSDAGRILRLVDEEAARSDGRRVSVLCIDAAPNDFLARELARRGGGVARFLTSNPDEEDITTALDEVLAEWAAPLWTDVRLEVNRPSLQVGDRRSIPAEVGWSAVDLGALAAGSNVWVAGRAPRGQDVLRLRLGAADDVLASRDVALSAEGSAAIRAIPAIAALFGAGRIVELEYLMYSTRDPQAAAEHLRRLGYAPDTVLGSTPGRRAIYAENVRADAEAALRDLLIRESLGYGLPSAETAFVGAREERGEPVAGTVQVANALPAGWSPEFLGSARVTFAPMDVASFLRSSEPPRMLQARDAGAPVPRSTRSERGGFFSRRRREWSPTPPAPSEAIVFRGVPPAATAAGEVVLFEAVAGEPDGPLPGDLVLYWLEARLSDNAAAGESVDEGLALLIYVQDASQERARVRLADLLRQAGRRPLHIALRSGDRLRIVLEDANGAWADGAPSLEVRLGW